MQDVPAAQFPVPSLPRPRGLLYLLFHSSGANQGHPPDATVQRQANLQSFKEDKDRFLVLHYVKTCTVNGFQPFDWMEDAERRLTMDLMNDGHFRMEMLKATRVRRMVLPQYPVRVNLVNCLHHTYPFCSVNLLLSVRCFISATITVVLL